MTKQPRASPHAENSKTHSTGTGCKCASPHNFRPIKRGLLVGIGFARNRRLLLLLARRPRRQGGVLELGVAAAAVGLSAAAAAVVGNAVVVGLELHLGKLH